MFARPIVLAACCAFVGGGGARGQNPSPLFRALEDAVPTTRRPTFAEDVNGDGRPDLIGDDGVLMNDGSDRFRPHPAGSFGAPADPRILALADFDGDGDPDALVREGAPASITLYTNDGTGVFAAAPGFVAPSNAFVAAGGGLYGPDGVFAVDVDLDFDFDVVLSVVTGAGAVTEVWRNDGTGAFASDVSAFAVALAASAPYVVAFRDLDFDGAPEFFGRSLSAGIPGDHVVLRNVGFGAGLTLAKTFVTAPGTTDGAFGDFNGDGRGDVVLAPTAGAGAVIDEVHLGAAGVPGGFLAGVPTVRLFAAVAYRTLDLDADGRAELARASGVGWEFVDVLLNGTGGPVLVDVSQGTPAPFLVLDLGADGDRDLIVAALNGDRRVWYAVNGTLAPQTPTGPEVLGGGIRCVVADVDFDGDADAVGHVLGVPYGPLEAVKNDGKGRFVAPTSPAFPPPYHTFTGPVAVADFDGNGVADFYEAGLAPSAPGAPPPRPDRLYLGSNPAHPAWVETQLNANLVDPARGCVAADLDGDGDADVLTARRNASSGVRQPLRHSVNLGGGAFAPAVAVGGPHWIADVVVADFDLDGDLDAAVAVAAHVAVPPAAPDASYVLWNQGGGAFLESPLAPTIHGDAVAVADFDLDGLVDLAFDGVVRKNLGGGVFAAAPSVVAPTGVSAASLLLRRGDDFDADGLPDLLGLGGWFRGLGGLGFAPLEAIPRAALVQQSGQYLAPYGVADFDRDGDLDLLDAEGRVFWNVRRHLSRGALARPGGVASLDVFGPAATPFVLAYSLGPATPPFPLGGWGTVFLQPASLIVLPPLTFDASGSAVIEASVPAVPALIGLALWFQAALPFDFRLTGPEEVVVVGF